MKQDKPQLYKGINPVIASIIFTAVTIAIGVSIAGLIFGYFDTYSAAPGVLHEYCQDKGFDEMKQTPSGFTRLIDGVEHVYCVRYFIKDGSYFEEYRWVEIIRESV